MPKRPVIDPNLFGATDKPQGDTDPKAHESKGTRAHGDAGTRDRDTEGSEAQSAEGRYRRVVIYLPPDLAQDIEDAYLEAFTAAHAAGKRITRSSVVVDLLRQSLKK